MLLGSLYWSYKPRINSHINGCVLEKYGWIFIHCHTLNYIPSIFIVQNPYKRLYISKIRTEKYGWRTLFPPRGGCLSKFYQRIQVFFSVSINITGHSHVPRILAPHYNQTREGGGWLRLDRSYIWKTWQSNYVMVLQGAGSCVWIGRTHLKSRFVYIKRVSLIVNK